jgi:hypothetical protein
MKLRLPVDAGGTEDRERQVRLGREVRLDACTPGRGDLFSDRVDVIGRFGVDEVARPLKVAVDAQLVDELRDALDRCVIRGGVRSGAVFAKRVDEPAVDEVVPDRQLRGGVSRDSTDDPLCLGERNRLPLVLQEIRSRETCDSPTEDRDIHTYVFFERVIRLGRRRDPQRRVDGAVVVHSRPVPASAATNAPPDFGHQPMLCSAARESSTPPSKRSQSSLAPKIRLARCSLPCGSVKWPRRSRRKQEGI